MNEIREERPIEYTPGGGSVCARLALDERCGEMTCDLGEMALRESGKLLYFSMTLKAVKPRRRVALGIALYETQGNEEIPCGLRAVAIPPHEGKAPRDVLVKNVGFVLPESPETGGERRFLARALAHYMDFDATDACACRGAPVH